MEIPMFITLKSNHNISITVPCTLTGEYDRVGDMIIAVQIQIPGGYTMDVPADDLYKIPQDEGVSDTDLLQDLKDKVYGFKPLKISRG
jgi:hypothetical protein